MKNNTPVVTAVRRNVSQVVAGNQTVNFYEVSNGQGFRLETEQGSVFLVPAVLSDLAAILRASAPSAVAQRQAPAEVKKRVRRTRAQIDADNAAAALAAQTV